MSNEPKIEELADIFAPTKEEYELIAGGVFVLKTKPANVVNSSYHQWKDIWNNKMFFRITAENPKANYQALSLSIPAHIGWPKSDRDSIPYAGYVLGISLLGGDMRLVPMGQVQWTQVQLADDALSTGGEADPDRACDASTMGGCNS
jgi:hypothetical protein